MIAEVTWNGAAKVYRVGKYVFEKGRTQIIDDENAIKYLMITKDFTVIARASQAPVLAKRAEVAPEPVPEPAPEEPEPAPEAEEPDALEDGGKRPARLPRTRFRK